MLLKNKDTVPWTYARENLKGKNIVGTFSEKELLKKIKQFRVEEVIKKMINYMLSGKVMIIRLIARLMKKISLYKMSYYPGPSSHRRNKIKVELDLSSYATMSDVKIAVSVNKPEFAKKRII